MAQPEVQYQDSLRENTSRGPSATIWARCPVLSFIEDPGKGTHFFDDFDTFTSGQGPWRVQTSTSTVVRATDETGGVIEHLNTATDNYAVLMQLGDNTGVSYVIKKDNGKKLWFEARFKVNSIADNIGNLFVGFAEQALGGNTTSIIDVSDVVQSKTILGFYLDEADGNSLDVIHGATGTAFTSLIDEFEVPVAGTYIKAGFKFDGKNTVSFYLNGLKSATDVKVNATNFPDDEELCLYLLSTQTSGSTAYVPSFDWVRVAMSESVGAF